MSPTIMQKCSTLHVLSLETSVKYPLPFLLLLRGKCINQKTLIVKTLPKPYTKRKYQRVHSKMCHLGMPAEQTLCVNAVFYVSSYIPVLRLQTSGRVHFSCEKSLATLSLFNSESSLRNLVCILHRR